MPAAAGVAVAAMFTSTAAAGVAYAVTYAVVQGAIIGAVVGAASSVATGGNIFEGALKGAVIGGVSAGVLKGAGIAVSGTAAAEASHAAALASANAADVAGKTAYDVGTTAGADASTVPGVSQAIGTKQAAEAGVNATTPVQQPLISSSAPVDPSKLAKPGILESMKEGLTSKEAMAGLTEGVGKGIFTVAAASSGESANKKLMNQKLESEARQRAASQPISYNQRIANIKNPMVNINITAPSWTRYFEATDTGLKKGLLDQGATA